MAETVFIAEPDSFDATATAILDAPIAAVHKAHIDPDLVVRWWAPKELETRIDVYEPKTGGAWRIVNIAPDGSEYAFRGVFHEFTPERIVQTWEFESMPGHVSLQFSTFEDVDGKTRVSNLVVCQSPADRDGLKDSGMELFAPIGMNQLERVAQSVA